MKVIRVLLVDDHALFRSGMAGLLRRESGFEVVGEAQDGEGALEMAKKLMPDIILMDIYMPGMGGLEATRRIKEVLPNVKIVMLTASNDDNDLFEAIKAGANGYLSKTIEPEAFFRMLRGVIRGEAPISGPTATKILGEFTRLARRDARKASPKEQLSPRERKVLELLTRGETNKEIASSLSIAENTVKNHLSSILEKLHLENRVQAATFALRNELTRPGKA